MHRAGETDPAPPYLHIHDPDAGAWKVDGTVESEVVSRILGKVKFRADTVRLHNPDMRELRRLLPNATFMVFTP
jgi:uncharacterized protein (UPF0216 family)